MDDLASVDPESYALVCEALGHFDVTGRLDEITTPVTPAAQHQHLARASPTAASPSCAVSATSPRSRTRPAPPRCCASTSAGPSCRCPANILCDVAAAQAVFAAGVPAEVTGIDQTKRVVLSEEEIAAIEACGALGALLSAEIRQFRTWLGRPDSPHDPIAVLAAVRPELFTFAQGWVRVNSAGVTSLERHADGPHRIVVDLQPTAVAHELLRRICRAQIGTSVRPS
ncbi:hypothetical protein DDE18_21535 [Nocardioides gansuensis]|uniref:Inosine/uridine-preferring nucleoside hydrolase domain-containing protein n=1 Tax=Nocardioides gansuensis TaxID=2138300 RepID=A0A2T8F4T1_9ACTN|nr:hypothetical protein DDE18_21535 [Nocardioides gansuensis]